MFWDDKGNAYYDLCSQTMNLLLGQSHPKVVDAAVSALRGAMFVDQDFESPLHEEALQALSQLLPVDLTVFNLRLNDGSSAVEAAVKQARRFRKRPWVLTVDGIYLGQNAQVIHFRGWGERPDDMLVGGHEAVIFAPMPYPNPSVPFEQAPEENGLAICQLIEQHHNELACVLLDPVMISCGVTSGRGMRTFLSRASSACKEFGVPLIFDECQTFGWVPDNTLAQHYGIPVDMLALGKGVGGGFPLAICASRSEFDNLNFGDADYTNGGTSISIAGLIATCNEIATQSAKQHMLQLEELMCGMLDDFVQAQKGRYATRGVGLIRCVEVRCHATSEENRVLAKQLAATALERGVYVRSHMQNLTIKPPRVMSLHQATLALSALFSVLESA